jgi:L-methionine (R)-S-oxide reductase
MKHGDADIDGLARAGNWDGVLSAAIDMMGADSGTLHLMGSDGQLHLAAASDGIPSVVIETVRTVPVGKGMAGLAVERRRPVDACNIQTDTSGDVRPGARATGLQGSIVVPLLYGDQVLGALGVANRSERIFSDAEQQQLLDLGRSIAAALSDRQPNPA